MKGILLVMVMSISFKKIMLKGKDFESIKEYILDDMKNEIDKYYYDEPAQQSTVWNFLLDYEKYGKSINQKTKSKSDLSWTCIKEEFGITKFSASKILKKYIKDNFKRHAILREIGNSYALESLGFYKESVIIAGAALEEILRLLIEANKIKINKHTFYNYLQLCENNGLLKTGINKLTDFVREYRNSVHLARERNKSDTINQANAKNAIASVFSVLNDLK